MDLGVTFIETTAAYGTQEIVAEAIRGRRDEVVISTKAAISAGDFLDLSRIVTADVLRERMKDNAGCRPTNVSSSRQTTRWPSVFRRSKVRRADDWLNYVIQTLLQGQRNGVGTLCMFALRRPLGDFGRRRHRRAIDRPRRDRSRRG